MQGNKQSQNPVRNQEFQAELRTLKWENTRLREQVKTQAREISAIGSSLYQYKSEIRTLTSQLLSSEAAERKRIAEELHDRIGQDLLITKLKLQQLRVNDRAADNREAVGQVIGIVDRIVNQARSLTTRLSSPILYELGIKEAIEAFVEKMEASCAVSFHTHFTRQPIKANTAVLALLYRCICEMIVNATKHAQAECVVVAIDKIGDRVVATVRDDGIGFKGNEQMTASGQGTGSGLPAIREKLAGLGGELVIHSRPGESTEVTVRVPCRID